MNSDSDSDSDPEYEFTSPSTDQYEKVLSCYELQEQEEKLAQEELDEELVHACISGNSNQVNYLLGAKADPTCNMSIAINQAASKDHLNIVELLLDAKADTGILLNNTISNCNLKILTCLWQNRPEIKISSGHISTAVYRENVALTSLLLKFKNTDFALVSHTCLSLACSRYNKAMVKILLVAGAKVEDLFAEFRIAFLQLEEKNLPYLLELDLADINLQPILKDNYPKFKSIRYNLDHISGLLLPPLAAIVLSYLT